MTETPSSTSISTRLDRIATLAREAPDMALTTLAHHIDIDWLREAYARTRKDGATGVDGQTAAEYAAHLEDNLQSLLDRAKSGTYFAPPVRRVHIPKGDGSQTRPIGIPTFEDKVLQRAVAMLLEAVYEQDFLDCSYGFRPRRSAHQALERLQHEAVCMAGGWVLEVDISKFFDTLDHAHLREILRHRVRDGVLLRLIGKWLNAGVMERGELSSPTAGTPQGGVISPLLANVYLHEVLDVWFECEVRPRLRGRAALLRYADDFVVVFSCEDDARRVMGVLPKRFGKYGLTLHPDKTRLVEFRRPDHRPPQGGDGAGRPGTFDLLGFTHFLGLVPQGQVGGEAANSPRPIQSRAEENHRVVQAVSAPLGPRAMASALAEAPGSLRVLRRCRELRGNPPLLGENQARVAQVARSPLAPRRHVVGPHGPAAGALSAPAASYRAALLRSNVAKLCHEEPDARVAHVRIEGAPGSNPRGHPSVRGMTRSAWSDREAARFVGI